MPSGKKEKDIKWLRTSVKKDLEKIVTKRKNNFLLKFVG
jgi:hypothetical protein